MNSIDDLFEIVKTLRGQNGCPWDKKQTASSMFKCLIEESYELEEAIVKKDAAHICEELGDVLFQLVFIIQILQEENLVAFEDVVGQVAKKMIRRHPHVYDDSLISTKEELDRQWDSIKAEEKQEQGISQESVLDAVPKGMPSLIRALNVSKKVVKEGFDWEDVYGVLDTVRDEVDEFESALKSNDQDEAAMEFGDILFSLVNVARFANIFPETALAGSTAKFEGRYRLMEKEIKKRKARLKDLSRESIDQLWEAAKNDYQT